MLSYVINNSDKNFRHELYRKAIHLSSLWMLLCIYLFPKTFAVILFGCMLAFDFTIEYACYKKIAWARKLFERMLIKTLRSKETKKKRFVPSGSVYVLFAALLSTLLFSKEIAIISLTVMLVSDTCAAIFGRLFGSRKLYGHKSLEGTTVFFISALYIMIAYNHLFPTSYAGIIACTLATLCELFESKLKIDDNLSIPLVIGFVLTYL